ncbi:MAG TPA: lysylphosphatidylglycerol synthase transmembrane domain-containing protein [Bryobacteraceae bacterium]|nr:lysylphosphatidylglycerol synthase transmembrane domain-containing protein [Bryobacteraceae bacterium]
MNRKKWGIVLGAAVVLAGIAFAAFRWRHSGFDWNEFTAALRHVDWSWLALSVALILGSYAGRVLRWEVMIRPLRRDASFRRIFSATAIGFTAVVLFGRAGEPVRPYLIAKNENVTFSSQIAAWIVERILDLLMVLLIFGIALTQVSSSAIQPGPKFRVVLELGGYTAGLTGAACLAVLIGLRQFRGRVRQRLVEGLSFLPERIVARIHKVLESFEEGMESTRSAAFTLLLIAYTVLEWLVIAAAFYCFFKGFPATAKFGITDDVILLGFVAFGSAVQIPGVGGGMQIAAMLVLTEFFGLGISVAGGIALVLWLISFVSIVPLGLAFAFHEGIKFRNLRHLEADEHNT